MKKSLLGSLILCLCLIKCVFALDLELTQGQNKALPIALVNFSGDKDGFFSEQIKKDLKNSGAFKFVSFDESQKPHNALNTKFSYWKSVGANNLIVGDLVSQGENVSVHFQLLDPISKAHIMLSREYTIPKSQLQSLAHHVSDLIYQQLTGRRGIFSTRLAYIIVDRSEVNAPLYKLEVSDYDGKNPQVLLRSSQPIMSLSWSPNAKYIAYVSFENKKSEIYIVNVSTGSRKLVSSFPGINGAPSWSPDSKQLAMVLSKTGSPQIYLYTIATKTFKALTNGLSINTEPSFASSGNDIIFTSNRGGSPQIYKLNLSSKKVERLSYVGNYNASASYTPSQKEMIMLHRNSNSFSISIQDLSSGLITPLTFSRNDESPSLAPNGEMVVYASRQGKSGILKIASIDGKVNFKLPRNSGDMQEPAWSPFLK